MTTASTPTSAMPETSAQAARERTERWRDIVLILPILAFVFYFSFTIFTTLGLGFYAAEKSNAWIQNTWYEGDLNTVYESMTSFNRHDRTMRHPLQSILTLGPVYALHVVGIPRTIGAGIVVAMGAASWTLSMYVLLRVLTFPRLDSALITILGICTASNMFWCGVPESFVFGGATIMATLAIFGVCVNTHCMRNWILVFLNVLSLSITTTNWMTGIVITWLAKGSRQSVQIVANGLVVTTLLWAVQARTIPGIEYFLKPSEWDRNYVFNERAGTPLNRLNVLLLYSAAMPKPLPRVAFWDDGKIILSVQKIPLLHGSIWHLCLVAAWAALLIAGAVLVAMNLRTSRVLQAVVIVLTLQLGLHMIYGDELFLFTMHTAGLLIILVAYVCKTRARSVCLVCLTSLALALYINNIHVLIESINIVHLTGGRFPIPPLGM